MLGQQALQAAVMTTPELLIALGGLVLHALTLTAAGIWQLSKIRSDLIDALNKHRQQVQIIIDEDRRAIQESLLALRQKITDVETDGLKTYVRRESFHQIVERMTAENTSFRQLIEARFDRQDAKMDRIIERQNA